MEGKSRTRSILAWCLAMCHCSLMRGILWFELYGQGTQASLSASLLSKDILETQQPPPALQGHQMPGWHVWKRRLLGKRVCGAFSYHAILRETALFYEKFSKKSVFTKIVLTSTKNGPSLANFCNNFPVLRETLTQRGSIIHSSCWLLIVAPICPSSLSPMEQHTQKDDEEAKKECQYFESVLRSGAFSISLSHCWLELKCS